MNQPLHRRPREEIDALPDLAGSRPEALSELGLGPVLFLVESTTRAIHRLRVERGANFIQEGNGLQELVFAVHALLCARAEQLLHRHRLLLASPILDALACTKPKRRCTRSMPDFVQDNIALTELLRELHILREHNHQFTNENPRTRTESLMLSEGAVTYLTLEHFVRIVVANAGGPTGQPLRPMLEWAVARGVFTLPWEDQQDGIRRVCSARNTLQHGNFEQAAQEAGCSTVREWFGTQYASEMEVIYRTVRDLLRQIDPSTGRPR